MTTVDHKAMRAAAEGMPSDTADHLGGQRLFEGLSLYLTKEIVAYLRAWQPQAALAFCDERDALEAEVARLRAALEAILAEEDEFRAALPADWDGDPLNDACVAARAALDGKP